MVSGVELQNCAMIVIGGPHGTYNRQVIDAVAQVRPPICDGDAAPAALAITHLHRQYAGMHDGRDQAQVRRRTKITPQFLLTLALCRLGESGEGTCRGSSSMPMPSVRHWG